MHSNSIYDSEDWVQSQVRFLQQQLVTSFKRQLDELPFNDPKCAFLMTNGLYYRDHTEPHSPNRFNSHTSTVVNSAYRGIGLQAISKKKYIHHFNRAALGGPEGLLHAEDLGVGAHNIAQLVANHKKPEDISQTAYDNSKKLGDLAKNAEDAVLNNNLDAGLIAIFGRKWLTFRTTFNPDTFDPDDLENYDPT